MGFPHFPTINPDRSAKSRTSGKKIARTSTKCNHGRVNAEFILVNELISYRIHLRDFGQANIGHVPLEARGWLFRNSDGIRLSGRCVDSLAAMRGNGSLRRTAGVQRWFAGTWEGNFRDGLGHWRSHCQIGSAPAGHGEATAFSGNQNLKTPKVRMNAIGGDSGMQVNMPDREKLEFLPI